MNTHSTACKSMWCACVVAHSTSGNFARFPLAKTFAGFLSLLIALITFGIAPQANADTTPPAAVGSLTATLQDSGQVVLNWSPSIDDTSGVAYLVYRNGDYLNWTSETSYVDAGLSPDTTYEYMVRAFDSSFNVSEAESVTISTEVTGATRVTSNLIAYYPFTAGSGNTAIDRSGFGSPMDLQLSGAVSWNKAGNGVQMNGGRVGTAGAASKVITALRSSNASSFEVWVHPSNLSQYGPTRMVAIGADPYKRNYMLGQEQGNVHARLRHTGKSEDQPHLITQNSPLRNKLMHIVHTYDGAVERLYIDGILQSAQVARAGSYSNWYTNHPLSIGNEASNNRPYAGLIKMVAVYNRSLNSGEIQQNFQAGPSGSGSNNGGGNGSGEPDSDGDGIGDSVDNCPSISNSNQLNSDGDGQGNACDNDDDNDSVIDGNDAFPLDPSESKDSDGDGIGNNIDNCLSTSNNDQVDSDGDDQGNVCDNDDDNDGVIDSSDAFPLDPNESRDTDGDGIGDNSDSTPNGDQNSTRVTSNLIAYYPFTAGSGNTAIDRSGFGSPMDLQLSGAVSWNKAGTGVQMNGGRVGTAGAASKVITALRSSNASSFEVWVHPSNLSQYGPTRMVAIGADPYKRNYMLGQEQGNVHARLRHTGKSEDQPHLITQNSPLRNKLMHIVHTYDGAVERLYIDGILQSAQVARAGSYSNWYTNHPLSIGNEASNNRPYAGLIKMVAVYNRSLNSGEIQQNFQAGPSGSGSNNGGGNGSGEPDSDGDGIGDSVDNCPSISNSNQLNSDGDGQGNACDNDDDNDSVIDGNDAFPLDPSESKDSDGDGIGDNSDSTPNGGQSQNTLNVSWNAPPTRADGEPLAPSELSRYEIYASPANGGGSTVFIVSDPSNTSFVLSGLTPSVYQLSMVAIDKYGTSSTPSNSISVTIQ